MFTGVINYTGRVESKLSNKLSIKTDKELINTLKKGTSIAVDGICFTVLETNKDIFKVEYMPETENRTNIKYLKTEDIVNLELPATAETFLSGSIVQGHVDATAKLKKIIDRGNSKILYFLIDKKFLKYIVGKGAIAINGISLTVINSEKDYFTVGIIPYTWEKTNFKYLRVGDFVNVELDIIGKYVGKLLNY